MKLLLAVLFFSTTVMASEIVYLADCKQAALMGPKDVEIALIGNAIAANIEGGDYGYFVSDFIESSKIEAGENHFKSITTSDRYTFVEINFETGSGRILERLLPTYYNCMAGGNPNACLVFNEILYSCKKRDYSPELFNL